MLSPEMLKTLVFCYLRERPKRQLAKKKVCLPPACHVLAKCLPLACQAAADWPDNAFYVCGGGGRGDRFHHQNHHLRNCILGGRYLCTPLYSGVHKSRSSLNCKAAIPSTPKGLTLVALGRQKPLWPPCGYPPLHLINSFNIAKMRRGAS